MVTVNECPSKPYAEALMNIYIPTTEKEISRTGGNWIEATDDASEEISSTGGNWIEATDDTSEEISTGNWIEATTTEEISRTGNWIEATDDASEEISTRNWIEATTTENYVEQALCEKEEDDLPKCHPMDVFIRWSVIRQYLLKNVGASIPNIYEGTPLRVRRCLYFMTSCSYSEALCLASNDDLTVGIVTVTSGDEVFGYYHLLFTEDIECTCTNKTAKKDSVDYPWEPPFIIAYEFVKA